METSVKIQVDDNVGGAPHFAPPTGDGWDGGPWYDMAALFTYIAVGALLAAVATS